MTVVFVTGGLGSGKSTFTDMLARLGAQVLSADEVVANLYETDSPMVSQIVKILGREILDDGGKISKKKIANKIFTDSNLLAQIEAIIHPRVRAELEKQAKKHQLLVYEIPVIKRGTDLSLADYVVDISAPEYLRLERAVARGMDMHDAQSRIAIQEANTYLPPNAIEISNAGDLSSLNAKAVKFYESISA